MKIEVGMYVRTERGKIWLVTSTKAIDGHKRRIVNADYNILKLIQVGDYVNGIRVGYINKGEDYLYALTDENTRDVICGYDSDGFTKPLHSIVTKEQFEQMEYKVGE